MLINKISYWNDFSSPLTASNPPFSPVVNDFVDSSYNISFFLLKKLNKDKAFFWNSLYRTTLKIFITNKSWAWSVKFGNSFGSVTIRFKPKVLCVRRENMGQLYLAQNLRVRSMWWSAGHMATIAGHYLRSISRREGPGMRLKRWVYTYT